VRRQVVEVARHKQQLLAAGQPSSAGCFRTCRRGVGKTHTVRHLTSNLPDTTVIQLTDNGLHLVAEACSVARALPRPMVVIEDVDLTAEDRGIHPGQRPLLFQLLNKMDGVAEDVDVVSVLTTNRANLREPALTAQRVARAVLSLAVVACCSLTPSPPAAASPRPAPAKPSGRSCRPPSMAARSRLSLRNGRPHPARSCRAVTNGAAGCEDRSVKASVPLRATAPGRPCLVLGRSSTAIMTDAV